MWKLYRCDWIALALALAFGAGCGTVSSVGEDTRGVVHRLRDPKAQHILRLSPYFRSDDENNDHVLKARARGRLDLEDIEFLGIPVGKPKRRDSDNDSDPHLHPWIDPNFGAGWDHGPSVRLGLRAGLTYDERHQRSSVHIGTLWHSDKGFALSPRLEYRRALSEDLRFETEIQARWWADDDEDNEIMQRLQLHQNFDGNEQMGIRFMPFEGWRSGNLEKVLVRAFYRMELVPQKHYLHIEPGFAFREDRDFGGKPTLYVRLDTFFGATTADNVARMYNDW